MILKCENTKCGKEHDGSFGTGRFCSRSCANSKRFSEEDRIKRSLSCGGNGILRGTHCLICNKKLDRSQKEYCSRECSGISTRRDTDKRIECGLVHKRDRLKRYIIERLGEVCSECGQKPEWNNKPLVLQLDHIDGDSDNNFPSNIRLVCPNCHTQTDTFTSRGYGPKKKKDTYRNRYLRNRLDYRAVE